MNRKHIRMLALILAAAMLLGGCASGKTQTDSAANGTQSAAQNPADTGKFTYQATYYDLPDEIESVAVQCFSEDAAYLVGFVSAGENSVTDEVTGEVSTYTVYGYQLYRMSLADGSCAPLGAVMPDDPTQDADGWDVSQYPRSITQGADGTLWLFMAQDRSRTTLPEDFDPETDNSYDYYEDGGVTLLARQFAPDGTLTQELVLDPGDTMDENGYSSFYPSNVLVATDGSFACSSNDKVYLWNADGTLRAALENEFYNDLQYYDAQTIGMVDYSGEQNMFQVLDVESGSWGEKLPLYQNAWQILPGSGEYDYYYYDSDRGVYGCTQADNTSEKLLDWLTCDLSGDSLEVGRVLEDGTVCAMWRNWSSSTTYYVAGAYLGRDETQDHTRGVYESSGENGIQIVVLRRAEAAAQEKTELTLATFYLDSQLRSRILEFNRTNPDYRIVVRDYSEYVTGEEDLSAGITKLNTEILSGNVPDLISMNYLSTAQYAARGVLEDLWPFIDADAELGRAGLMTQVLDAMSIDGKLYRITDSFSLNTAIGMRQVVGDVDNWTVAAAQQAMESLQEGATYFNITSTKDVVLSSCLSRSVDAFVDWQSGKCSFDSPEFVALLEFSNSFPEEFDYSKFDWADYEADEVRMREGRQLLASAYVSSFDDLQYYDGILKGENVYVGWPTGNGENNHSFQTGQTLAMTTRCEHKDAAWAFMRTLLTSELTTDIYSFPINRELFDRAAKIAMTPEYETDENGEYVLDENGDKIEISSGGMSANGGETVEFYAVTQAQYDKFMALLDQTTAVESYDSNVLDIITEETGAYFAGEKSAQDTAAAINNRVGLYVAEQK